MGVDVGGTFTDVVVYDEGTGVLDVAKSPTTRADPAVGLLSVRRRPPTRIAVPTWRTDGQGQARILPCRAGPHAFAKLFP